MTAPCLAIGVMSGTSLDGIDLALVRTDGELQIESLAATTLDWPPSLEADLRCCVAHLQSKSRAEIATLRAADAYAELEQRVSEAYVTALKTFMRMHEITDVDLIGVHGQTICHRPPDANNSGQTWQLGDGAMIAHSLGTDIVSRFRDADIVAGGQGAPLAPFFHAALVASRCPTQTVAVVNLGGVANLTWIEQDQAHGPIVGLAKSDVFTPFKGQRLCAFDTGPGSALIDDEVCLRFGQPFDQDGAFARKGQISFAVLEQLLANPYFDLTPPKSLDRQFFHIAAEAVRGLVNPHDAIATLTAFTVETIGRAEEHLPSQPDSWLICGGGRHNQAIMAGLESRLSGSVQPIEAIGCNGDSLEAECFAWLAVRCRNGRPISGPETTGAPEAISGGHLDRGTKQHSAL